jgi:hypothetical protein
MSSHARLAQWFGTPRSLCRHSSLTFSEVPLKCRVTRLEPAIPAQHLITRGKTPRDLPSHILAGNSNYTTPTAL